uniref:Calreticulin family protein n=1 Tax=Coptotermes formosanus TaxID=36987 RepID=L0AUJ9_COPFO|nr:calreticulin family protein [Coptotermes formosanus]
MCIFLVFDFLLTLRFYRKKDKRGFPLLPDCQLVYYQNFPSYDLLNNFFISEVPGYDGEIKITRSPAWPSRFHENSLGFRSSKKSHAIAIPTNFSLPDSDTFLLQYETRNNLLMTCNTQFITLFEEFPGKSFSNQSKFFLEFGPEVCGKSLNHVRFRIKNSQLRENILIPADDVTHQYTLIIRENGTFEIMIDTRSLFNGTFKDHFEPEFENVVFPQISGYGFNSWMEYPSTFYTNILIGTNEKEIKKWNKQDFARRQRIQIQKNEERI